MLLSDTDLTMGGLPKASIVKLGKIFTIHQGLIRKKLGHVSDSTLQNILQKLLQSMQ
jgi:mRNA-degrading endonuclease toxin of MazEF toxin-antitoxin module